MTELRDIRVIQRLIAGYLPATVIPAIVSIFMVVVFTRLLSPGAYGRYTLAVTVLTAVQSWLLSAANVTIVRFYPVNAKDGLDQYVTESDFLYTANASILLLGVAAAAILALVITVAPLPAKLIPVLWLAIPLLPMRAVIATGQAARRVRNETRDFCLVEGGRALLGFAVGLLCVALLGPSAESLMLGLNAGSIVILALTIMPQWRSLHRGRFNPALLASTARFAAPLSLTFVTSTALQYGDRFLVAGLAGPQALAIYVVAAVLVDRPTTMAGIAVTTATFPFLVRTLEADGKEAARLQFGANAVMLISVGAPACVGLMLIAPQLADIMVGPEFRGGLARLLPIVAGTAFVGLFSGHLINHAYHMAKRTDLLPFVYAPFVVLNLAFDVVLIPRFGIVGAAWAALVTIILQCAVSTVIVSRIFPIFIPLRPVFCIGLALLPMITMAFLIDFGNQWLNLITIISESMISYGIMVLLLDIAGARALLALRFSKSMTEVAPR